MSGSLMLLPGGVALSAEDGRGLRRAAGLSEADFFERGQTRLFVITARSWENLSFELPLIRSGRFSSQ
jgi:hypothetical protein